MASVGIYLNFAGDTEAAFEFYSEVFGVELTDFMRMGDMPADPAGPQLAPEERDLVMHVEITLPGGVQLMGTDILPSMGHELRPGNNLTISLTPDTLAETQRLFDALSAGGSDVAGLQQMFWGAYWGTCLDPFGTRWMFNFPIAQD